MNKQTYLYYQDLESELKQISLELHNLKQTKVEELDNCPVCGELYNKKNKGIACSTSCLREKGF